MELSVLPTNTLFSEDRNHSKNPQLNIKNFQTFKSLSIAYKIARELRLFSVNRNFKIQFFCVKKYTCSMCPM